MKRIIAAISLCLCICSGCQKQQPDVTQATTTTEASTTAAPVTPDSPEKGVKWYEKIKCNTGGWTGYVAETVDYFFYTAEDGLWRFDKATQAEVMVFADEDLRGVLLSDDSLYYHDRQAIYRSGLDGSLGVAVWQYDMCPDEWRDDMSDGIRDFQAYAGCLYILVDGLQLVKYDLNTKISECLLEDVASFTVNGNYCYYIEHASRSFSVFQKDLTTGETVMLRGDGKDWDAEDKVRYDTPVCFNGQLFFTIRQTENIFLYSENGEDTLLLDPDNSYSRVIVLEHCGYKNLCYYVYDGTQYILYERDGEGNTTLLLTLDKESNPYFYKSVRVVDSAVFWKSTEDGAISCFMRT